MKSISLLVFIWFLCETCSSQKLYRYTSSLPATDELGRKLPSWKDVGDERKDRYVGLFYWTWHTHYAKNTSALDLTRFLKLHPYAIRNSKDPAWGGKYSMNFWGEPLFGFYRNTDEWVLRKHAELLGEAGVDVIIFDCTNGEYLWTESYTKLCEVFEKARRDGVRTPQIAFMTSFFPKPASRRAITKLYNELYKPKKYSNLWFYWKGKPLIMAYKDGLSEEIQDFFTFRPGQPDYKSGPRNNEQWGWLEIFPQHGYVKLSNGKYEQMPVGVAQNWSAERGLTAMNAPGTFGRSYTHKYGQPKKTADVNYGKNFQEQWNRALKVDPQFIFITGWNEWIAGRQDVWREQKNAFPDEFSQEKSRDIEPMRGGHTDNYYYQMVANIRRFKGMPQDSCIVYATKRKINWNYWAKIDNKLYTHKGNTIHRDHPGWKGIHYINKTGRNDLSVAKISHDTYNVYFYIECTNTISSPSDKNWMRLFIDIDCNHSTGWEGYDFVVNRLSPRNGRAILESNINNKWSWRKKAEILFSIRDNKLFLTIPKRCLGLREREQNRLEFKWADNTKDNGDISDFLVYGDIAPIGRFNYDICLKYMK